MRKNEGFVCQNFIGKIKRIKPKYEKGDLVSTTDLKKMFSKPEMTNWSYKMYKITENNDDTIPSYRTDNLQERYNEALLKKTE